MRLTTRWCSYQPYLKLAKTANKWSPRLLQIRLPWIFFALSSLFDLMIDEGGGERQLIDLLASPQVKMHTFSQRIYKESLGLN